MAKPFDHLMAKPFDHLMAKPFDHLMAKPFDHLMAEPFDHLMAEAFDHLMTKPFDHLMAEAFDHFTGVGAPSVDPPYTIFDHSVNFSNQNSQNRDARGRRCGAFRGKSTFFSLLLFYF